MLEAWVEASIGDLATWLSGGTPLKSEATYWDGDIPWISGASLTEIHLNDSIRRVTEAGVKNGSRFAPQGATLILVRGMSLHQEVRIGHAMRQLAFNQDVKALTPNSDVDPWFLTWALLARHDELLHMVHAAGHGTGVLATDRLKALTIPLPPLAEQRRIAGVLGALDDLIETNRRLAEVCEALAMTIAESATGRTPLSAIAQSLNAPVKAPRGPTDHFSLPTFDVDHLPDRVDGSLIKSNKVILDRPCVLVSRLNPHIPRVWMVYPESGVTSAASTEFVPLVGRDVCGEEIWAVCANGAFLDQMNGLVTGTTGSHQRVNKEALLTLEVPDIRSVSDSKRMALRDLMREGFDARASARTLSRTRDELLPLLLSGAVTVPEVAA